MPSRATALNDKPANPRGRYVLYWMQQSQRGRANAALEEAVAQANELKLPVLCCFGLVDNYPDAGPRHYRFQLEGLRDAAADLKARGVKFVVDRGEPKDVCVARAKDAAAVVCDVGYLRHLRQWRAFVGERCACRVTAVEADLVVPIRRASEKAEFAALPLRRKLHRVWDDYLVPLDERDPTKSAARLDVPEGDVDLADLDAAVAGTKAERDSAPSPLFTGGRVEALAHLERFTTKALDGYAEGRNEPARAWHSYMSMHLQYGHVSPVEVALAARDGNGGVADKESYVEELVVRRELTHNWCFYKDDYDRFEGLPTWAKTTLAEHARDKRPYLYTRVQLEAAETHDSYWNAAMRQSTLTGFMHNYMRMYWGKKVLEWSPSPQDGFATLLHLNNKFFLDGLNANSYGNVAWVFGQHDRPWQERPVFGKVRYMNESGLKRKFDIDAYVRQIDDVGRALAKGDARGAKRALFTT